MSLKNDNDNLGQNLIFLDNESDTIPILKQNQNSASKISNKESKEYIIEKLPENVTEYDKSVKVILLGDSNVGKTSILNCLEQRDILQQKTISLEYFNYNIKINSYIIRMQIWDTVGQEKFNSITKNYYKTTDVVIFIYAINDLKSFNNIEHWFNELNDKGNINEENIEKNMIKILVGNKKDLIKERTVTYEMGEKLKKEKNFNLFKEISCHYDIKSEAILNESGSEIMKNDNENNLNVEQNSEEDKDCIKNLFFEIAKICYKEYVEDHGNRMNSSIYYYEASNSILEITPDKTDNDISIHAKKRRKDCCCC